MSDISNGQIQTAFEHYKRVLFGVDVDLNFWRSFLNHSIKTYQNDNFQSGVIYDASFSVYNLSPNDMNGYLNVSSTTFSIETQHLEKHRQDFFRWVTIMSILKTYNSLEILLLEAIYIRFFEESCNPLNGRKAANKIHDQVRSSLSGKQAKNTRNNRHLIQFLKDKNPEIEIFLSQKIRTDLNTTWENFFEFISILRNVIAHQGTVVNKDTYNDIKSIANDLFHRHFNLQEDARGTMNLFPIEDPTNFSNFLNLYNDFVTNCIKLIFGQKNLRFLNLNDPLGRA